jgi:GNAT superfamily N-acetyltransferase
VPAPEIRPFNRADREQLTALVNVHVAAVLPGVSISVNTLMSQLEREPGEAIVDPWVVERQTLVAVERDAIVAGAHLLRYGEDERVSESYRGIAEIRWLVCSPDAEAAGDALVAACIAAMSHWGPRGIYADGSLPAPAAYGVPDCWPHIRALYVRTGFVHEGHTEVIHVAEVDALPQRTDPPVDGLTLHRRIGPFGVRFEGMVHGERIALIDLEADMTAGGTRSRLAGWADIGNLCVAEEHRRKGVGRWLLGDAAEWLRLGRVERLLTYAWPEEREEIAFVEAVGFRELLRTERGWRLSDD